MALERPTPSTREETIITSVIIAICTVIAAVVSVVGTLAATIVTQHSNLNNRRLELEMHQIDTREQRVADAASRDTEVQRQLLADKTNLYAELNAAARSYRSVCTDFTKSLIPDEHRSVTHLDSALPERIEKTRLQYRSLFARAQMMLADDTLEVATETNRCLAHGFSMVKSWERVLQSNPEAARRAPSLHALEEIDAFLEGPCDYAITVQRRALRVELGVSVESFDFPDAVKTLVAARRAVQWAGSAEKALSS